MSVGNSARIGLVALQQAIAAADASALLVAPRILRRVIKHERRLTGIWLQVPHRKTYVIGREPLLEIVDRTELGVRWNDELPKRLILIASPTAEALDENTSDAVLLKYWRLLFHARVHLALEQELESGNLNVPVIRRMVEAIGQVEFDEARSVLRQENFLYQSRDEAAVFIEFAAVYLELRYFAATLLPCYFPLLEKYERIDEILAAHIDAPRTFSDTRLVGAPDPELRVLDLYDEPSLADDDLPAEVVPLEPPSRSERSRQRLIQRAARAASLGNVVRAAILRMRAAREADRALAAALRAEARGDLARLAERLQDAVGVPDEDLKPLRQSFAPLLDRASRGPWTPEARLLYDLQKVCVDHERNVYALDVVEWAVHLGRVPLKRPLPSQREVMMSKHLRTAVRRLSMVRVPTSVRDLLLQLLQKVVVRAEEHLRDRFRPQITKAIEQVGLRPRDVPETVARDKLVEEFLDRVVRHGLVTMGDLRDILSRNNLKLPDLSSGAETAPRDSRSSWIAGLTRRIWRGTVELLSGDPLLRIDRRLARSLDGVYRRGEIYRRFTQRLSATAFGTRSGRFLTRFVAIPYGGAYLIFEACKHIIELFSDYRVTRADVAAAPGTSVGTAVVDASLQVDEAYAAAIHSHPYYTLTIVLALGTFILAAMNVDAVAEFCRRAVRGVYQALRGLFVDLPTWILEQPLIREILESRVFLAFRRFVLKPAIFTALVLAVWRGPVVDARRPTLNVLLLYAAVNIVLNSRIGRDVDEVVTDWVVRAWHHIRLRVLSELARFILDTFQRVLQSIERLLYTVDEWLRFKSGESQWLFGLKVSLGVVWFFVTYLIRFCVTLLIEPQVNPIKHFPVVTVAHKIILPLGIPLAEALTRTELFDKATVATLSLLIVSLTPGVFGFLVWELKENWRLYEANRAKNLKPVPIGHHNETMLQLLRPGFHFGTLPKRYARLRRADRRAWWSGQWKASRRQRELIHEDELTIRHFIDRERLRLLAASSAFDGLRLTVGSIVAATNSVRIELWCRELDTRPAVLAFDESAGLLLAELTSEAWVARLDSRAEGVFCTALLGVYKLAGVDLVREEIVDALGPKRVSYCLTDNGLLVWPEEDFRVELVYSLVEPFSTSPRINSGILRKPPRAVDVAALYLSRVAISWREWTEIWRRDQNNEPIDLSAEYRVKLLESRDDAANDEQPRASGRTA